jgi:Virulence protein RhuM family
MSKFTQRNEKCQQYIPLTSFRKTRRTYPEPGAPVETQVFVIPDPGSGPGQALISLRRTRYGGIHVPAPRPFVLLLFQGRRIERQIEFFNLDAIISVGYRVNSKRGTQFRIRATQVPRERKLSLIHPGGYPALFRSFLVSPQEFSCLSPDLAS